MQRSVLTNTLVAVFRDRALAESARQELLRNGFDTSQVEVSSTGELMSHAGSGNAGLSGTHRDSSGGGLSGFFSRLFGTDTSDDDRTYYSDAMRHGDSAVIVHADHDSIDRATDILNASGAIEVSDRTGTAEERSSSYDDRGTTLDRDATRLSEGESATIPVVREDVQVGKRAVQRGGVRIHSTVQEHPVEADVELREERVRVDRRPADRLATDADLAAADRDYIEVTETAEEPVITKSARVVEEVVVTKDVRKRKQKVRDKVQQTEVRVEDARGDRERLTGEDVRPPQTADYDTDFRDDFRTRYGAAGDARYEDIQPAYTYGYEMANDARYRGRRFEDVEETLRTDYLRNNPDSAWDRVQGAVRYGWEKMTGKR